MMSIDTKSILQIALLLLVIFLSPSSVAQSGPDAFDLTNLPLTDQVQLAEQVETNTLNTGTPTNSGTQSSLVLADRMALEYRIAQQRYRFYEVVLLSIVAVVTLLVVLSFMRDNPKCQPRDMVNTTGLILVIFSTIIVILLADVEVQLTAAMGVLGGIAGYLFGTINSPGTSRKASDSDGNREKVTKNKKSNRP